MRKQRLSHGNHDLARNSRNPVRLDFHAIRGDHENARGARSYFPASLVSALGVLLNTVRRINL